MLVCALAATIGALVWWGPTAEPPTRASAPVTTHPSASTTPRSVPAIAPPMPQPLVVPATPYPAPPPPPKPKPLTLAAMDARMTKQGYTRVPESQVEAATFGVGAYNVLGASHTTGKKARKGYARAEARLPGALDLVDRHGITVAGLQEFQPPQVHQFLAMRGPVWDVYPRPEARSDNAIIWRKDIWSLQETRMTPIPYFGGRPVGMPVVLLQHRVSGRQVWFGSYHNPANIGGDHTRWRREATFTEARLAQELSADGTPVVMTGDFNDRADFACPFSAESGMESADGARTRNGRCELPGQMSVDWIFGTTDISFSGYQADWSSQHRRLSDHPLIASTADLAAVSEREDCKQRKTRAGVQYYCPTP